MRTRNRALERCHELPGQPTITCLKKAPDEKPLYSIVLNTDDGNDLVTRT